MHRPSRQQVDAHIVDTAACVFARHGLKQTSVQAVANAAGYSKASILSHFGTKELLQEAVVAQCIDFARVLETTVADQPVGPDRDRAVLEAFVDLADAWPGCVALLLGSVGPRKDSETATRFQTVRDQLFAAFGVTEEDPPERWIRVGAAVGAIGVIALGIKEETDQLAESRELLVQAAFDALGHHHSTSSKETVN